MRSIFFLLLLTNVVLLFWRYSVGLPDQLQGAASGASANRPVISGQPLHLLNESVPTESIAQSEPRAPMCKMVGPFDDEKTAATFIERLAVLDVVATVRYVESSSGESYWVHFPAQANRDAARRQLAQLQARGVDSYIIPKGEFKNGISLGVFSQKSSADAKIAELKSMGYAPEVQIIGRSYQEVWVMLNEGEEQKLAESTWKTLTQMNFSLQEQENLCLDVASH